ncbi:podocalyxin-like protein 2 isoform X2 [Sapajus apella]|uniref:Podocalyxin-like protein 2 isoform X2 n=1 Tax=Sapajus apella TaxID=9515 RepID=A0A6J3H1H7_SAPAP|nr:podocalyxin-like protein 2 isoform X2 [Sapajus apella]
MGRLLQAAGPLSLLLQLPLLLLLAGGASLGACAAGSDEPGPEGLTSTSLLDLLLPTGLEPLDSEEPSETMGLGAGLGAPGSGFPSEESEESRILQPPQYFWEEEEELNDSSLDLGPTADYVFPDLTEKAGSIEDTSQAQELPSLPSPLPKMNLVEPPWHMPPAEEEEDEEEEEEEREKEEVEKQEEEEEEELLPVNGSQEAAKPQVRDFSLTSSSQTPGATKSRHEDPGDQSSSGVEVESSMGPSLLPPSVTPTTVTLRDQDSTSQEAGATVLPAAGLGVEFQAPQEASEETTAGAAGLSGQHEEVLASPSFPQTASPSGAEDPDEGPPGSRTSASFPLDPGDMELTPSSATLGQEDLNQQLLEGQAAEAQSTIPWDSTQVICKDWSNLAGKNYIILNMTENIDCGWCPLKMSFPCWVTSAGAWRRLASRTTPQPAAARRGPARCAAITAHSSWCWWSLGPSASSSLRSACSTTAGSAGCPSSSTCRTARSCALWRTAATTTPRWTWPATASRRCRRSTPA